MSTAPDVSPDSSPSESGETDTGEFAPTRAAGLDLLTDFVPHAGRDYATGRNTDPGPGRETAVSMLSRYVSHRLVTEREIVEAVLARHSQAAAQKFVQEVFWRTYWKGWLELRPSVWAGYRADVDRLAAASIDASQFGASDLDSADDLARALEGRTGIECFDAWRDELVETGYLHNHTRMWFASIWIFTLGLPWQLGADFFYRHLLDGDPASNTLSWRWVAGLQTTGKTYLATADNIEKFTEGRFRPTGLAPVAPAIDDDPVPEARELPAADAAPDGRVVLLLHDDDTHAESLELGTATVVAVGGFSAAAARSPLGTAEPVLRFAAAAVRDGVDRARRHFAADELPGLDGPGPDGTDADGTAADAGLDVDQLVEAMARVDATTIVTPYAPTGPVAERLDALERALPAGIHLVRVRREWDTLAWPHARRGFFPFRERIAGLLRAQGLV
ncbi:FAD-binding domain-containing protein [Marisediminicola senii]|uniref:FAD-binding domain-containing protein n=1 Tax=Marisediminicola senii TaxID=2711233 RepID=UPI0013E9ED07|nr:FAD-binding domain-containing protein [Marisediminicola senii]